MTVDKNRRGMLQCKAAGVDNTDPDPPNLKVYPRPGFTTVVPQLTHAFGQIPATEERSMQQTPPLPDGTEQPPTIAKVSAFCEAKERAINGYR